MIEAPAVRFGRKFADEEISEWVENNVRESQFTEAVRLLAHLLHLACPPQTERYREQYMEVVERANELLEKVEVYRWTSISVKPILKEGNYVR